MAWMIEILTHENQDFSPDNQCYSYWLGKEP